MPSTSKILFPNERINFDKDLNPLFSSKSDFDIDSKYAKGEVRIVTEMARYPLPSIPSMIDSGDYELNPEFQRRHRWTRDKQSRLIESFIMNVPIPPVFLYEDQYSHYEVMDGLQRMTAINEYYSGRLRLEGLKEWPELNGRTRNDLPEQIRRGIDRRYLSSIILLQETAKDPVQAQRLKQLVFERINSGGERLQPQESRNAIYNGPMNSMCIDLARNPLLCRMWRIPEPDEHEIETGKISSKARNNVKFRTMFDVELVLRFFAYRQRIDNQNGSLEAFLNAYLRQANTYSNDLLEQLTKLFNNTINLVYECLGDNAFLLYRLRKNKWVWLDRPTTVVYDPMMYAFSQFVAQKEQLLAKSKNLKNSLENLYIQYQDEFEGRYTNKSNMIRRNQLLTDWLSDAIS